MADILVRDVPREVLDTLKKRAAKNRRSLQQELLLVLEDAAGKEIIQAAKAADMIRERLAAYGRSFSDSTGLVREDRER
ncbi:MAG: Arc family DNA-binding protein [Clostridia bacterium]|nr:Arc family DNA-binding protein [Clostridia bacterium]